MENLLKDKLGDGDSSLLPEGQMVGHYRLEKLLGKGGMGRVYKAWDSNLERDVAVKFLLPGESKKPEVCARFIGEARAAAKLQHPNAVSVYEIGNHLEVPFIVMEFLEGGRVSAFLKEHLPLHQALDWILQAAQGLAAAHKVGLVHRDIKPENLLLTKEYQVKISDFGLSKLTGGNTPQAVETSTGIILGTPDYMSPEQFEGTEITPATDIYSLGATLYTLISGARPFPEANTAVQAMYAHCQKPPPDIRQVNPGLPESLARVIVKSMAKKPGDRYSNAGEFFAALKSASEECIGTDTQVFHDKFSALVIEPSRTIAGALGKCLESQGAHSPIVKSTGQEGLAALRNSSPSVIVSPWSLPDMTGAEFIQKSHTGLGREKSIPIICSASTTLFQLAQIISQSQFGLLAKSGIRNAPISGIVFSGLPFIRKSTDDSPKKILLINATPGLQDCNAGFKKFLLNNKVQETRAEQSKDFLQKDKWDLVLDISPYTDWKGPEVVSQAVRKLEFWGGMEQISPPLACLSVNKQICLMTGYRTIGFQAICTNQLDPIRLQILAGACPENK